MTPRIALSLAVVLAAAACRNPLFLGGLGDAGADTGVDPPSADVLDVLVLDDAPYVGTGAPLAGVTVSALDARGLHEATTDADGRARVEGLDFAGDPPDVTFAAPGFALFTVVDLGRSGPVPEPLEVGLGAFEVCSGCRPTWPTLQGPIDRLLAGSTVVASLPGAWGASASEHYFTPRDPALPAPLEVRGIELLDEAVVGVAGPALAPELEGDGPRLTFHAVTPATAAVTIERRFGAGTVLSGLPVSVQIADLNAQARPVAVLGGASTIADQVSLSYADEVEGVTGVWAELLADGGTVGATAMATLEENAATVRLLDPPKLAEEGDVFLPSDELEIVASDAPDQVHAFTLADAAGPVWIAILSPGASAVRFPFAPPGRPGDLLRVAAAAVVLDRDPWEGHVVLRPRARAPFWRSLAFDARRLAIVE